MVSSRRNGRARPAKVVIAGPAAEAPPVVGRGRSPERRRRGARRSRNPASTLTNGLPTTTARPNRKPPRAERRARHDRIGTCEPHVRACRYDGLADVYVYVDGDRYRVTAAHDDGEEFKLHLEECYRRTTMPKGDILTRPGRSQAEGTQLLEGALSIPRGRLRGMCSTQSEREEFIGLLNKGTHFEGQRVGAAPRRGIAPSPARVAQPAHGLSLANGRTA